MVVTRSRWFALALAGLSWLGSGCHQYPLRTEVAKPTTPADDAKPNSPAVPEVYAATGQFERVVVVRLKYDTDLWGGLQEMVRKLGIRQAVILGGIGSVRGYHVHTVTSRTFPSHNVYTRDPTMPADLLSMGGYVMGGKVHAHVSLADPEHAFGGHLEPGTTVFTFAIVTLGVLGDSADLRRMDDKTYR
jgi:predicted DNA-binding protein with PD1-like motif